MRKLAFISLSLAMVILIIGVVVALWNVSMRKNVVEGIDVSHHNGSNVEQYLKDNNSKFLIAKATEGASYKDGKYEQHLKIAKRNKVYFGAYHFLNFDSDINVQFDNFKSVVKKGDIEIRPVVDVELYGKERRMPKWGELRDKVRAYGELCKEHYGCYPIIYCNEGFRAYYFAFGFKDYPFWVCNYVTPTFGDMHQYQVDEENWMDRNKVFDLKRILL